MPNPQDEWLEIGRIVAPQGLDGSVRVYPDTDFPERFLEPGDRWLSKPRQTEPERVQLLAGRYLSGKGLYVIKLSGITTREQAESLRDAKLLVPESDRLPLTPGEFYTSDLIGLQVRLQTTEQIIGTVVDVYSAGNDLLAVKLAADSEIPEVPLSASNTSANRKKTSSQNQVLIPFVHEIVPVVDLAAGYVEINPPQGLLPAD
jgi:16S rRNA processing protein RimM